MVDLRYFKYGTEANIARQMRFAFKFFSKAYIIRSDLANFFEYLLKIVCFSQQDERHDAAGVKDCFLPLRVSATYPCVGAAVVNDVFALKVHHS